MRVALLLWTTTLSSLVLLLACRGQGTPQNVENARVEALRFPHDKHAQVACLQCHIPDPTQPLTMHRPGALGHKSCAEAQCHAEDFAGPPTELCALCHEDVAADSSGESPLVAYPPRAGTRSQAVAFSHQSHLDLATMEERLGFHLSCIDCHAANPEGRRQEELERPDHAACERCHAAESAPTGTPSMVDCSGCHQEKAEAPPRERDFIQGDLQFSHRRHRSDRKGRLITCSTCHLDSTQATKEKVGRHAAPNMRVCVSCHDDRDRVASQQRMSRCETCHLTRSAGLSSLAPRSHMPATERPADHTRAFRRDHAADAQADSANCGRCHTMLSGNRRDTCDECHQVMRPSDHVVTWREYDHGNEAATEAERCTTCHQADFCTACHRSRPRSHFPLMDFKFGGHGTQAVLNMRACITCHEPTRDCSGDGCHRGGEGL
jgi:hypothetical protein